jgi:predicted nuclease with TOPRIM domain
MITDEDTIKLVGAFSKVFATKQDLEKLATQDEMANLRNDVMTKMDSVYKEVIAMRQEQTTHQADHDDIKTRLTAIESTSAMAHDLKR